MAAMSGRRPELLEAVRVLVVLAAVLVAVYLVGGAIEWVRFEAARLPADAGLQAVPARLVFATGVKLVVVMVVVFAAMCAVAWLLHGWTWGRHAAAWHRTVRYSRGEARRQLSPPPVTLRRLPPRPPTPADRAPIGDTYVRIVAGFNVGVVAATIGLGLGQAVKGLIDQAHPGYWWSLLLPWLVFSLLIAGLLALIGPLRGGRIVHGVIWGAVVILALLTVAPVGLLLLTWVGIATGGRAYGTGRRRAQSFMEFLLSAAPWILLLIYALVGIGYVALPPVGFARTTVQTAGPAGTTETGGWVARSGGGVTVASCTPLADATSVDARLVSLPASAVRRVSSSSDSYDFDSGARPNLPTLALHLFGIDARVPTVFTPRLRARTPTCQGSPQPRPSIGFPAPALGAGVIAGLAPSGGRAHDGEAPIQVTSPRIAALARALQPTLLTTVADPFWPVSVNALLDDAGAGGGRTCLHHVPATCFLAGPTPQDLPGAGSSPSWFLQFPVTPPLGQSPLPQLDAFLRGQSYGRPVSSERAWLEDPGWLDPWYTAEIYFFYAGAAAGLRFPVHPPGPVSGLDALQYWFFYPYNYFPTVATPDLMDAAPVAGDVINTDLHQGDWEHIDVLVDHRTGRPQWLYLARHANEGAWYPWGDPAIPLDDGHPVVQAAIGGHPTYLPGCGARLRYANGLNGVVADWEVCGSGRFAFRAATTPLVDIARTPWACWQGHFGVARPSEVSTAKPESSIKLAIDQNVLVAGPRGPLWNGENGHLAADGPPAHDYGFCAGGADPLAPERVAP
jgi:hypothetical protein